MKHLLSFVILFFILSLSKAQDFRAVDFTRAEIRLKIDPLAEKVEGRVNYQFTVGKNSDSVFLDAREMDFDRVKINGRIARYSSDQRYLVIHRNFRKNRDYSLEVSYTCHPKQALYFLGWKDSIPGNEQVWTQGQGKYNSHWVPSIDEMSEKVIFNLEIEVERGYEVIANGRLTGVEEKMNTRVWRWTMTRPMSSYLLAFAIGKYAFLKAESDSGIPIEMYYYPSDSLQSEPTFRFSREIFNLLEREIGVPYPWQNYKMIPVRDFLYAGMENTGTTFFSDGYVVDSIAFTDRNFVTVNAHELAHQWFGNLVTETNASSHWLHEGFSNYFAWQAEKEFLGEDFYYWLLFDKAEMLKAQDREGRGESLLNPKAGSLTFYDKGGLAVEMLRQRLGDEDFKTVIRDFLRAYAYKSASVDDFLGRVQAISGTKADEFLEAWLESDSFPGDEVINYLKISYPPIEQFLRLKKELISNQANDEAILARFWEKTTSSELRKRMLLLFHRSLSTEFLARGFESGDLEVRQALSLIPGPIPFELMEKYETLLADRSYITLENALYKLWLQQPEKRALYLDQTRGISGFPNKNIRQLWLLLAILTKDYGTVEEKGLWRKELFGYTSPHFPTEVRELAFGLIREVFPYPRKTLRDLVNAAVHPSWQFRQYARSILEEQLQDERQRNQLQLILEDLQGEEYRYLSKLLEQK